MKRWKNRLLSLSFAAILMLSLTACEEYDEWEANAAGNGTWDNSTYIETDYDGPSLADYVNEGLEEAKDDGLYEEVDYSDIMSNNDSNQNISGSNQDPGQNELNSGQNVPDPGQDSDNSGQDMSETDWPGLMDHLAELEYEGEPYVYVNDNVPYFTDEEFALTNAFESYSGFDSLGRTGQVFASLNEALMPEDDEERGDISSVKPSGWVQAKYDGINNGGWLYNRCHLIAWALASENDNALNLMTGTRYFNVEGMLPFEMQALDYVNDNPDNHLLYRATPIYEEDGLLAKGLLLEAYSIEDGGELSFCVYLFNVQPGVVIDYETGKSHAE